MLKEYLLEVGRIADREVLIQIGKRPDDGIVYTWDMFDTTALVQDIGEYVTKSFTERNPRNGVCILREERETEMIQKFEFTELDLKGAYHIKPFYATDDRGV